MMDGRSMAERCSARGREGSAGSPAQVLAGELEHSGVTIFDRSESVDEEDGCGTRGLELYTLRWSGVLERPFEHTVERHRCPVIPFPLFFAGTGNVVDALTRDLLLLFVSGPSERCEAQKSDHDEDRRVPVDPLKHRTASRLESTHSDHPRQSEPVKEAQKQQAWEKDLDPMDHSLSSRSVLRRRWTRNNPEIVKTFDPVAIKSGIAVAKPATFRKIPKRTPACGQ